jgi:hypothetical protein
MVYFRDAEGHLRSHCQQFGKVVEETYKEGGQSIKEFKGMKTVVTYHWDGEVLAYDVKKDGAPLEEATTRRWIEPDGRTMKAESLFRKDAEHPWAVLKRTWHLDPNAPK